MYGTSPMFTMPVSSVDSGRSNDNYGNWNNPFVHLVWMWAFSMFGGNGLWGNRNGVGTVETQSNAKAWTTKTDGFLYWLLRGCGLDWLDAVRPAILLT